MLYDFQEVILLSSVGRLRCHNNYASARYDVSVGRRWAQVHPRAQTDPLNKKTLTTTPATKHLLLDTPATTKTLSICS